VTYNLGGARLEKLEYEEALRLFKQTIQKIEKLKQTGQDQQYVLLLPRAHLSTGAAYVRSADKAAPENRETLCQMSQVELEKARELISPTDSERAVLLDKINLTQARVYLARRDWGRALETLKTVSLKNDPDLDLLLSIAYFCNNDEEQADTNLLEFLGYFFGRRDDPKYNDDREYEQRLKMQCASERGVPK
jgi:hypothetical protein